MPQTFEMHINGVAETVALPPDVPLLHVLRNHLHLTGTRYGCGLEQCGCCMVLIDGAPAYACTRTLETVHGCRVETVEGLAKNSDDGQVELHALQKAFLAEQAGQCGYCLSGILMSAKALLRDNPNPDRDDICRALDRHLCRCGAHTRIIRAVFSAAATLRKDATS